MRTFLKYLFAHLPDWGLGAFAAALVVSWGWLSWPIALALLLAWIAIELAIYPLLRGAYRGKGPTGVEKLVGMVAQAREPLRPSGFVSIRGEMWKARLVDRNDSVPAGALVRVTAAEGLTLVVTSRDRPGPRPAKIGEDVR